MRTVRRSLGFRGAVVVASALLACGGCAREGLDLSRYTGRIKVACVGDSITVGATIVDRQARNYPRQLQELLGKRFEVRNFGKSGATLQADGDLSYRETPQFEAATAFAPDVVVMMLGTNDTKPQNWESSDRFARDYRTMLDHFEGLPSKPVIWVVLPAPVLETRWGINRETMQEGVLPVIRQMAKERGHQVIDLNTPMRAHPEWFSDKVHPNGDGAAFIAGEVRDALLGR